MKDKINPAHYQRDGIECHEAIAGAVQNLTGIDAYDTGAAIKYLWRWDEKHPDEKTCDLNKAIWYIRAIIDRLEEERDLSPEIWKYVPTTPEEDAILDELISRQESRGDG